MPVRKQLTFPGANRALAVAALNQMVLARGPAVVDSLVKQGSLHLTAAARKWWAGYTNQSIPSSAAIAAVPGVPVANTPVVRGARFNGDITLRHRELVQTITGTGSASNLTINAGSDLLFPYLSRIAQNFDYYEFKRLSFSVVSSSPTTVGGSWTMSVEPDASEGSTGFIKPTMMAQECSVSSPIWNGTSLSVPVSKYQRRKLMAVTPSGVGSPEDSYGILQFIHDSSSSVSLDIYVEYETLLKQPQVGVLGNLTIANGTSQADAPWASGTIPNLAGTLVSAVNGGAGRLTFNMPGFYLLSYRVVGTALTSGGTPTGTYTAYTRRAATNAAATTSVETLTIQITAPGQYIVSTQGWATITSWSFMVVGITQQAASSQI